MIQNVIFGRYFKGRKKSYSMFLQNFQGGKIYKQGDTYTLKIEGKEFTAKSLKLVLEAYSKSQHKSRKQ